MSAAEPDHVRIDALVLIGIANPFTETVYTNPLSMVLAVVDTYDHSVLSAKEVEHAVRDLSGAGLICVNGMSFRLTGQGEAVWRKIQSKPMMHEQYQPQAGHRSRDVRKQVTNVGGHIRRGNC